MRPIYLDHHATTPLDPRVLDTMLPYLREEFGNAASVEHRYGWVAEEAVAQARKTLAAALGARSETEIVFTSGATESNNLALLGAMRAMRARGDHLITLATEHKAVLDPVAAWCREGGRATVLPVQPDGLVDLDHLRKALEQRTALVSVMLANNEIGVIQPLAAIGALLAERGILLHCDATQAFGKLPIDVEAMGIHLLSLSAHKLYGPKGIGALYVRRRNPRVTLQPLVYGGGHERGMRSGTLNVPAIVGLAEATRLALAEMDDERARIGLMRDRLLAGLRAVYPTMSLNGHPELRLAGNLNIAFPELDVALLVKEIYGEIALSTGAACTSAEPEPSHVLRAIEHRVGERASSSIRIGIGRFNTESELDRVLERLVHARALARYR